MRQHDVLTIAGQIYQCQRKSLPLLHTSPSRHNMSAEMPRAPWSRRPCGSRRSFARTCRARAGIPATHQKPRGRLHPITEIDVVRASTKSRGLRKSMCPVCFGPRNGSTPNNVKCVSSVSGKSTSAPRASTPASSNRQESEQTSGVQPRLRGDAGARR